MIWLNDYPVNFKQFPNKESYADMEHSYRPTKKENVITFKFENDSEIFYLSCVRDFVSENYPSLPCHLVMPYIPYSRMDRQEEKRLFTLKTFVNIINSMNFTSVKVMEPHSEVSVALLNRTKVINKTTELVHKAIMDELKLSGSAWLSESEVNHEYGFGIRNLYKKAEEAGIWLVYPDAGAEKRYKKQIKYPNVLTCSKDRDFNTGRINSIAVNGTDKAQDCKIAIIADDLSSKGGTFSGVANDIRKSIPNIESIILCVTHCENTIYEGKVLSDSDINKVYTTNSIIVQPSFDKEINFDRNKLIIENVI